MKKKSLHNKKKLRKRKQRLRFKCIVASITFLFSGLMVLGSTYAWFVSEDTVVNEFVGSRLSVKIVEDFQANEVWQPGLATKKIIQVKNTGNVSAFVRMSFYEYLLTFKIDLLDQTGNGNLAVMAQEKKPIVEFDKTATWVPAVSAGGTYLRNGKYYIAEKAIVPTTTSGNEMYKFKDSAREQTALKWFNLNFPMNVYDSAPPVGTTDYWLYSDGYFYYSELLNPGEVSQPILSSVRLNKSAPNKMKGALYQLNPMMDAHDSTNSLVTSWNISMSSDVYRMLQNKLSD